MKYSISVFVCIICMLHSGYSQTQAYPSWYFSNYFFIQNHSTFHSQQDKQYNTSRPSIVWNYAIDYHKNFNKHIGIVVGTNLQNIGAKVLNDTIMGIHYDKIKRRAYYTNARAAMKFGNFENHAFLYFGAEIGKPLHFRQKKINKQLSETIKSNIWFNQDNFAIVNPYLFSFFIGLQLKSGINISGNYYPQHFINSSFPATKQFGNLAAYSGSHIYSISLSYQKKILPNWKLNNKKRSDLENIYEM